MKKIEGSIDISNIKRCYVEGAIIEFDCPECNKTLELDLSQDYLSYPEVDDSSPIFIYCEVCEDYFGCPTTVKSAKIVIEYDETKVVRE